MPLPPICFLHADSCSPATPATNRAGGTKSTCGRLESQRVAGHFRLKFRRDLKGNDLAYSYYESKSALNRAECTNGDQGLLIPAEFFQELGGFDESLWFLEDQRLAEKIRRLGTWITLSGELETSARRFEQEGLGRRMILSALIMNFTVLGLRVFERADTVYRNQGKHRSSADDSDLPIDQRSEPGSGKPRFASALACHRPLCSESRLATFFLSGCYSRQMVQNREPSFLTLHDKLFRPVTSISLFEYLTAGLTWIWFQVSWIVFALLERRYRSDQENA